MNGGTVICGVDETAEGADAPAIGHALAARLGLRLVLVSVIDGIPAGAQESLTTRQRQAGADRTLALLARDLGDGAERRVVVGERAEALAQVAADEGADLIVLGSRPAGLGSRRLRCNLARDLEAITPVPVFVAPPSTRQRSGRRLAAAAATR
jgi:nucleotide-binding universal stress UspA family protein